MSLTTRLISAGLTAALAALASVAAFAQSTGQTVRHHKVAENTTAPELAQAEAAIEKRDYAAAEPLLHKVVSAEPANFQAWYDLGFVYNGLDRTDESIAAYRKSVAAKPDVFESNFNLGLMLARARQPEAAEQFLRAATKLTPTAHAAEGRARAWLSLAHLLEATKPEEAVEAYKQAAMLQPKDPEPHLAAGQLLEKEQHFADAEQEYRQALALDSNSADALTGLANIYMRGRRFPEAEQILRKLAAARPEDVAVHMQLGRVLAASGKKDEAIAELEAASKLPRADASVQRDLADLYVSAKKYNLAEAQYRALLVANPKDAVLHDELGKALLEQHKFPEAQQEFESAASLKPDFGPAFGDLAFAASENKNYPLVIFALDKRKEFLPEIAITYFLRASAYDHLRDVKRARENYHLFLDAANGQYPDQEWQARHRLIALEPKR